MSLSPKALRRIFIWGGVLVALAVAYTVFGFAGVPWLIKSQGAKFVQEKYNRKLSLGEVHFNPFTLQLELKDFALPDADGSPMLAAHRLFVAPKLWQSIWNRGATLADIQLEQPLVRARMRKDGALNLLDLTRPFPPEPEKKPSSPARFFLGHLRLSQGDASYEDLAHPNLHAQLKPINFELRDFNTIGTGADGYVFNFAMPAGGQFHWQGNVSASPVASKGSFSIHQLKVATLAGMAGDDLPVSVSSPTGQVDLDGAYDFSIKGDKPGLLLDLHGLTVNDIGVQTRAARPDSVNVGKVAVQDVHFDLASQAAKVGSVAVEDLGLQLQSGPRDGVKVGKVAVAGVQYDLAGKAAQVASMAIGNVGVRPLQAKADYVSLPDIEIGATQVDLGRQAVQVAAVDLKGGDILAWRDKAGINLLELAGDQAGAAKPAHKARGTGSKANKAKAAGAAPAAPASGAAQAAWTVDVPHVGVQGLKVAFQDRTVKPAANVTVAPLDVTVTGFKLPLKDPLDITAETRLNGSAHLAAKATASPAGAVKAHVDLSKFDLKAVQPYVAQFTSLTLVSGTLGSKLDINVGNKGALGVKGDIDVARFRTVDDDLKQDLVKWDNLKVSRLDYQAKPAKLSIRTIDTSGLYARVILAPDRTLNITDALRAPGTPKPVPPADDSGDKDKGKAAPAPAAAPAAPAPAAAQARAQPAANAMPITIGRINIHNGSANYADEWIQPNFAIGIQQMEGGVQGISSDPNSRARIDIKGSVDKYAPAHIYGEANPLAATLYTDIHMDFTGIDLTSVNPYSGRYAGYKIAKGKLTTQLAYKIDNRKLNASHHVVVDQLELGDRVDSPDAIHLPLKIAIALLRDRHGVIDLDLPITGTLDDPQFRIAPIIWKVLVNVIEKAVTAPFALLGHLFGGGDQVNQINFQPGSAVLDQAGRTQIGNIAKGLVERPGLELDIPAVYTDLDEKTLGLRQLRAELGGGKGGKAAAKQSARAGGSAGGASAGGNGPEANTAAAEAAAAAEDATEEQAAQAATADPAQYFKRLQAAYLKQAGKGGQLPPAAAAVAGAKKDDKGGAPDYGAANTELETALLAQVKVDPAKLQDLGLRRARAVQDALLTGTGVEPTRVFVVKGDEEKAAGKTVVLAIKLKQ